MQDNKVEPEEIIMKINKARLHYLMSNDEQDNKIEQAFSDIIHQLRDEYAHYFVCFGVQSEDSKLLMLAKSDDIEKSYYKLVSIDYVKKLPDDIVWTYDELNKYLGSVSARSRIIANKALFKVKELGNLWKDYEI